MEGLLIAQALRTLTPLLPSPRLSWRFPDPHTFVLPLKTGALWLYNRPPNPRLAYLAEFPPPGGTHSGFQELLVAKVAGNLISIEQLKLDRVVRCEFAASEGFVSTPPVTIIAELTGRHCNLILVDAKGVILGQAREVSAEVNRFRQLKSGLPYAPPPPYQKLEPRTASDEVLSQALIGQPLDAVKRRLDGFGPQLTQALAQRAGLALNQPLSAEAVAHLLPILRQVVERPSAALNAVDADIAALRQQDRWQQQRQVVQEGLSKRLKLLTNQLDDAAKALAAAAEAADLRRRAEVLLAYARQVPEGAREVTLTDFTGEPLTVALEPGLGAVATAQKLFEQAKKREQRARQAEAKAQTIQAELDQTQGLLARLEELSPAELAALAEQARPHRAQFRAPPGIRYTSPQGFAVLVGRNAQDNDTVTFKLAKSRDLWLHVQGYTGSHVVIQAEGREVPFETILFAAQLAAAYSRARHSDNVPVDYTLRKHVWKAKGGAPGAVYLTQQKTVYVTPNRNPDGAA
ncbi:MAG: NFACT family protein [Truepera sp.]|nr:NFACT family protein [Truepera sp.]